MTRDVVIDCAKVMDTKKSLAVSCAGVKIWAIFSAKKLTNVVECSILGCVL